MLSYIFGRPYSKNESMVKRLFTLLMLEALYFIHKINMLRYYLSINYKG